MKSIVTIGAWALVICLMSIRSPAQAQLPAGQDSNETIVDGIRFVAEQFAIDPTSQTATVTLSLTSLNDKPRELKINVYGTQLVDNQRNAHYFSTVSLGRVLIRFEDKQNYLHYLLQPDTPTTLTITAAAIPPGTDAIQLVKIIFEDSKEEGRFLEVYLTEPAAARN